MTDDPLTLFAEEYGQAKTLRLIMKTLDAGRKITLATSITPQEAIIVNLATDLMIEEFTNALTELESQT